jgi:hypothetical protein
MIDDAGAAPAAAETVTPSQDLGDALAQPDAQAGEAGPVNDRSKETARASIDRAFAEIDGKTERARDEDGRFKASDPQPAPAQRTDQKPEAEKVPEADKTKTAISEAPARFSADAKAAWATVPDSVRDEVHRAFREMESGLVQYQRVFEPLKPFYQLAEKHDTTVEDALGRYVALDSGLASDDPVKRFSAIAEVLEYAGLSPEEYAAGIVGQKSDGTPAQSPAEIQQLKGELAEMRRLIGGVGATLRQSRESQLENEAGAMVAEFAKTHPRLNEAEFAKTLTRLIATQMADDLASAYDMAERLTPTPVTGPRPAASIAANPPKPADQTRKGQLSIAGAPVSGSNPVNRKPAATARESLDRAFAEIGFSG